MFSVEADVGHGNRTQSTRSHEVTMSASDQSSRRSCHRLQAGTFAVIEKMALNMRKRRMEATERDCMAMLNTCPSGLRAGLLLATCFVLFNAERMTAQSTIFSLKSSSPGVEWRITPQAEVGGDSVRMLSPGYNTDDWVRASVPGTVFGSYVDAGKEKDPNYADNIYGVDKSLYDRNFWYRTEFIVPNDSTRERLWLNVTGVNRDADVFLNGKYLGSVKGFMQRGTYDITRLAQRQSKNVLALLVYVPQYPISNGASPTYGSSAGWDWMPCVPGLNMGITGDVSLSMSGVATIVDPWISADLPNSSLANITLRTEVRNHSRSRQRGMLRGVIQPGNVSFSLDLDLPPTDSKIVLIDYRGFPQLSMQNPRLWWPNGYGPQNLYTCELQLLVNARESDHATVQFGMRKIVVDTSNNVMTLRVNGERVFVKGGNWGMSEYMLRARGKDYDTRIKLHKDMNLNLIRNWMGSTTDEDFYSACDTYGILVWDDFWLDSGGGLPRDINIFNANAIEKIKRLRNHPCIALWCGMNEGYPDPPLNDWLRANVAAFDGRHYHPNSHSDALSGSGPWYNLDPKDYFMNAAPGHWGGTDTWGMRSEIGTAVFVNLESLRQFLPPDKLWPRNELWDKHFFGPSAQNAGPETYEESITTRYGKPSGIEDFCRKAQLLNIETTKAMFEGWLDNLWNDASGIVIWMSQSAYPSMVWQTYDYYFDATGAYWGAKKACEPVHVQWNPCTNSVKAINTTSRDLEKATAEARIYSLDGSEVPALRKSALVNVAKDSLRECFTLTFPGIDLARGRNTAASSVGVRGEESSAAVDGNDKTKWESDFGLQQWISVDLEKARTLNHFRLHFDSPYAKTYKIQLSHDAATWRDVYYTSEGKPGITDIRITPDTARYLRMFCIEKGTRHRVSLWSFEVYDDSQSQLSDPHFIALRLNDQKGNALSENFYWRGGTHLDYRGLAGLAPVDLASKVRTSRTNGRCVIDVQITNPESSPAIAFAVHLSVVRSQSGERILPVYMNDNYFSLVRGETKRIRIECDEKQLGNGEPRVIIDHFNPTRNERKEHGTPHPQPGS